MNGAVRGANLVISFQRSGLNWLRHCAEFFGGVRTPGHSHLIREGKPLFDRTHDVTRSNRRSDFESLYDAEGNEIYARVALLLRDPWECFVSHYLGRRDFSFREGLKKFEVFAINIAEFDRLRKPHKAVFFYEEFINREAGTFAFLRFLGIEPARRAYDFDELIASSREWYGRQHGLIAERARPKLNPRQRSAIERMLKEKLGQDFPRYLGRYSGE